MTSNTDPFMNPGEALEAAVKEPENIFYPYHILDQGNLRYVVADIYNHDHVSPHNLTWGDARATCLRLNDPESKEYLPYYPIPLKTQKSVALYLIRRRREVERSLFLDAVLGELMTMYNETVQIDFPRWKNPDKPEFERTADRTRSFRGKILAKKLAVEANGRTGQAFTDQIAEYDALLAELPDLPPVSPKA